MATVYLALRETDGRQLALKVAHETSTDSFEPLRREASLLSRIDVDGISRLLDAGECDGIPWYTMEYVAGPSLAELWAAGGASALLDRWLLILARLCQPLLQLHSLGIVHRDLKPQNIVVAEGDHPVIVDFGLSLAYAAGSGRDLAVANPAFVGTVAYMSPEQLAGATLDSRSDIYSFGCLLYEAAAGTPPFSGSSQEAVQNRLDSVYTPLAYVSDVPPWLSDLVDGMLEKHVGRRIAYLGDVADALAANGYAVSAMGGDIRPTLYRPRLSGRDGELKRVRQAARRARAGNASCILICGESGIGKTRLINEAGRIAAHQRFSIVASSCHALDVAKMGHGGSPLYPLRELFRAVADHCLAGGAETLRQIFGDSARVLVPYDSRFAQLPGMDAQPALESVSERVAGNRTLTTLTSMLKGFAMHNPVLVAIDDVQWADEMTLDWLASLGDSFFSEARVLIIATYCSEEVSPSLARLRTSRHIEQLPLSHLKGASVNHMLEDVLAARGSLPGELVRKMEDDAEGNPFFIFEYLRAAVEDGYLTRNRGTWAYSERGGPDARILPMPSSVRDLLVRRMRSAGDEAFRLAQVAAVVGRRFTVDDITAMTGQSRAQVRDGVLQLERCDIVESDGDTHQFNHDKLLEVAHSELPADLARSLHRERAEAIERATAMDARVEVASDLAFHWIEAGERSRGFDYLLKGGEYAASRGAYSDAYRLLSQALTTDAGMVNRMPPGRRGRILQLLGLAAFNTGDLSASIRHSKDALRSFEQPVPSGYGAWIFYMVRELANLILRPGGLPGNDDQLPSYEAVAAREQLALSLLYRGNNFEGVGNLIGALRSAVRIDAADLTINPCVRLGFLAQSMRLGTLSKRLFDRASRTAERHRLPAGRGLTLYMEAEMHMGLGQWEACRAKALEAARLFIRLGDPHEAETAWTIASHGMHYEGELAMAGDTARTILKSAEDRNHGIHVAWGLLVSAKVMLALGDTEAALGSLLHARDNILNEPDLLSMVMIEGVLVRVLIALERWEDVSRYTSLLMEKLCSRRRPMVPQCVDGYEGLVDGALALWARDPANAKAKACARRACRSLRGFVMAFPMAKPVYLHAMAALLAIDGRPNKAQSWCIGAVDAARTLRTPLWEAEAHLALADIARDRAVRHDHERQAAAIQQSFYGARTAAGAMH